MQPSQHNGQSGADFFTACSNGDAMKVSAMLAAGSEQLNEHALNSDAFVAACTSGHEAVVQLFLTLPDPNALDVESSLRDAFGSSCAAGHVGVVKHLLLLDGPRGDAVLLALQEGFYSACRGGHSETVRLLLSSGDPDQVRSLVLEGDSLAMAAAAPSDRVTTMRLLLEPSNAHMLHLPTAGWRALDAACSHGYLDALQLLLELPPPNAVVVHCRDEACLQAACMSENAEVINTLLALPPPRQLTGGFLEPQYLPEASNDILLASPLCPLLCLREIVSKALDFMYGKDMCDSLQAAVGELLPLGARDTRDEQLATHNKALLLAVHAGLANGSLQPTVLDALVLDVSDVYSAWNTAAFSELLQAAVLVWLVRAAALPQCRALNFRTALLQASVAPAAVPRHGVPTSEGWCSVAKVQRIDEALPAMGRALQGLGWGGVEPQLGGGRGWDFSNRGRCLMLLRRYAVQVNGLQATSAAKGRNGGPSATED